MVERITCCVCHIPFFVEAQHHRQLKQTHKTFWCPSGHGQSFVGDTEEDKLRRERDLLKQQLAQKDDEIRAQKSAKADAERKAAAARGQVTRLKKRASAGLCPCCNRHFTNLERHMASKHTEERIQ